MSKLRLSFLAATGFILAMRSLLLFLGAFLCWGLSYAFIERVTWLGLTLGAVGCLVCLAALVINHLEHTR